MLAAASRRRRRAKSSASAAGNSNSRASPAADSRSGRCGCAPARARCRRPHRRCGRWPALSWATSDRSLLTMRSARFSDLCDEILQRQASERQRHAAADAVAVHVDQFERTAAEIADDAVGIVDAGDDAERGKFCLARSRQDFDLRAADALGLGDEVGTVGGVAAGGGGDRDRRGRPAGCGTARESAAATSAPWRPRPAASRPVLCTSRPSPHSAFSLKMVTRLRAIVS